MLVRDIPTVLKQKNYKKLISYQKEKLETVLARSKFSPSKEKNYQLIKEEISQDILQLQLNPATQEEPKADKPKTDKPAEPEKSEKPKSDKPDDGPKKG